MGTDRDTDSPVGRLRRARMEDPTVDALATMAASGGRDPVDPDVLTQIIAALVVDLADARRLLMDLTMGLATAAPVAMAAPPPPVLLSGRSLADLRTLPAAPLVHRASEPEADAPAPDTPGRTVGHFEVEAVRGVGCLAIGVDLRHLDPSNVAVDGAASLLTVGSRVRVVRDDDADGPRAEPERMPSPATYPEPGAVMGPLSIVDCRMAEGGVGGPSIRLDVHLARGFGRDEVEEAQVLKGRIMAAVHGGGPGVYLVREPSGASS